MKFIHTADLHLDSPFLGLQDAPDDLWETIYQSTFNAFKKIVDFAIENSVDFVCIVGDIYDREQRSIAAENYFITQCLRLKDAHIPVYLSYGNHDYQQIDRSVANLPDNVHVFSNEVETKHLTTGDQKEVAITGFSYPTQWLTDDQTNNYPAKQAVDWQIGMLHGTMSQLKTPHDNYAPFSLDELLQKNYDYWALGHIHKRQILHENPVVAYSGNPQGRHKNEAGVKGFYLVSDKDGQLVPEFHEAESIEWQTLTVIGNDENDTSLFLTQLKQQVVSQLKTKRLTLLNIIIQAENEFSSALLEQFNNGSLLSRLQNDLSYQSEISFWPYELSLQTRTDSPVLSSIDQDYWDQAAQNVFSADNIAQSADKLFSYDFIETSINNDETRKQVQQAITLMLQQNQVGDEKTHED